METIDMLYRKDFDENQYQRRMLWKEMREEKERWKHVITSLKKFEYFKNKYSLNEPHFLYRLHDIDEELLRKEPDAFDWKFLSIYQSKFSEDFLTDFCKRLDMTYISGKQKLSEEFIESHMDILDMRKVSYFQELSIEFIKRYKDKISWVEFSMHKFLTDDQIKAFKDDLNWKYVCNRQHLSESIIEELKDYVDWNLVSIFQVLSFSFIWKYRDMLNLNSCLRYQIMTAKQEEKIKGYMKKERIKK